MGLPTMNALGHLIFEDFNRSMNLINAPELADGIREILSGWNVKAGDGLLDSADMTFEKTGRLYDWSVASEGLKADRLFGKPRTVCDAVCDFHYEAYRWYRETFARHLCVHAAAVEIGGTLMLFPNTFAAGKSTLAVALAAEGMKIFGDDVVAIDTDSLELLSLGIMPRLRLPLPRQSLGLDLLKFLKNHAGISGSEQFYTKLNRRSQAALGERRPIGGFVILDRLPRNSATTITEVGQADILKAMIEQNFNTKLDVNRIFQCLRGVVSKSKAYRLAYSDLREAVSGIRKVSIQ